MAHQEERIEIVEFKEKAVYLTPPHAPALVTTISSFGNVNLAPFEQVMICSDFPPMLVLAITPDTDTVRNLQEVCDELVVGIPTPAIADQVYACGEPLPRDESEFVLSGLTPVKSRLVRPPRILECQVNFECRVEWIKPSGGDHHIVLVRILLADVWKRLYHEDKVRRRCGLDYLYYASSGVFFTKGPQLRADKTKLVERYRKRIEPTLEKSRDSY